MSNLETMRARIADELTWKTAGTRQLSARIIDREINTAIRHYETMRVPWTEVRGSPMVDTATSAGARYYSLTANFLKVDSLKLHYNDAFIVMNFRTWRELEEDDRQIVATQGVPEDFAIQANVLRLWPVPNGAYSFDGSWVKSNTTLSAATDTNNWLTDGEELIRARARAACEVNFLQSPAAMSEMHGFSARGLPFLSVLEEVAHRAVADQTSEFMSTGKLKPYYV